MCRRVPSGGYEDGGHTLLSDATELVAPYGGAPDPAPSSLAAYRVSRRIRTGSSPYRCGAADSPQLKRWFPGSFRGRFGGTEWRTRLGTDFHPAVSR